MATQYSKIIPTDYNNARTQVAGVLGVTTTGDIGATQGYGQALVSSPVSQHEKVTEAQLDTLRLDIITAHTHQNGITPVITNVAAGDIGLASLFTSYETLAAATNVNKNIIAANQLATVIYTQTETYAAYTGTIGTGGGWKNYAFYEVDVTFPTADAARYFFNTGSRFSFTASRSGGTVSPTIGLDQNLSWTALLQSVTADNPTFARTDFYSLTDSYATVYNRNSTGIYSVNYYRISAKSNIANNVYGGATVVTFKIEFDDGYNDGNTTNYDGVDGTFVSTIVRSMPKGVGFGGAIFVAAPTSVIATPTNGFTEDGIPIYITASYAIAISPSTVTEDNAYVAMAFEATSYNVPNTVTWTITATTTTGLNDFVETGWTAGTNINGFKTLTRTVTTTGTFASSQASTNITTNPDTTTEGTETFTISAVGSADGSGGGFVSNVEILTVTDSSKTATPGITISGPTVPGPVNHEISCIPGEGLGASASWAIVSSAITGNADLVIYGIYLDLSDANLNAYRMTLWDNTVLTQTTGTYYTLPTPRTVANGSSVSVTIQVGSTSGPAGLASAIIRLRTNAGSSDGSGPNTVGPSFNQISRSIPVLVIAPTVTLAITANPTSVAYTYVAGAAGSGSTQVTVTNNGNARATLSNYNVSSPGGTVSQGFISGLILAGGSTSTTVTYSSTVAYSGTSVVSITGANNLIGTVSASRNIAVTATESFGIISQNFSLASELSAEVFTAKTFFIVMSNSGQAPLTVTNITFSGATNMTISGPLGLPLTIQPGNSVQRFFTWSRSRIGSSTVVASITSNTGGNAGTITSTSQAITGTARVPTFLLAGGSGSVSSDSWTNNNGILLKDRPVSLTFFNCEPGTEAMVSLWWTVDQDSNAGGGRGVQATTTTTDPKLVPFNFTTTILQSTSLPSGEIYAWIGADPEEVRYWRAGRNRFYVQLPVGKTDTGTQIWYTNARSGTSAAGPGQWATIITTPEAPCGPNQTWIGFTVEPVVAWSFSTYEVVQGGTVTVNVSGAASNCTVVFAITQFQDSPSGPTSNIPFTIPSVLTNGDGRFSGSFTTGTDGPFGPQAAAAIGTYFGVRPITPSGHGAFPLYSGPFRTFDVLSPAFNITIGYSDRPGSEAGEAAHSGASPATEPAGTFVYYRRTAADNATYQNVNIFASADDRVEVFAQGNFIGRTSSLDQIFAFPNNTVVVSDGFAHWKFVYTNFGGPGYFAVAVYVGTNLFFSLDNPAYIRNRSKW